jgi:protein KIAA0825
LRNQIFTLQHNQVVLQETICSGIVGGRLDFPRYASFASVKICLWLEDEYFAAYSRHSGLLDLSGKTFVKFSNFLLSTPSTQPEINDDGDDRDDDANLAGCGGIVKSSDPEKFVSLTTKSTDSLLEHIHILSQEALDHADLSVLTATIGAAALIKNSLYVYLQNVTTTMCPPKGDDKGGSLKLSYKQFSEMTEALAERLLDLHCRLLTLYIIQDADGLHWESNQPFFESERSSYTIQMWWLYMKGTRQDLWNSVPPSMAQRVFAGMLNETLTILTVRYTQTIPSKARSQLLLVDISNILLCVAELLPSICEHGEAYIGLNITNQSKIIRDLHAKCHELFCCFLLRGAPLGILYKLLKKGTQSVGMFVPRKGYPSPWLIFAWPQMFPSNSNGHLASKVSEFGTFAALTIELKVLLASPQANWPLLIKVENIFNIFPKFLI